jgi:hypothetical protein
VFPLGLDSGVGGALRPSPIGIGRVLQFHVLAVTDDCPIPTPMREKRPCFAGGELVIRSTITLERTARKQQSDHRLDR